MKQALFRSALLGACLALLAGSAVAKDHGRDRGRDDRGRARFENRDQRRSWGSDRDRNFRYVSDRSRERERERARARSREREREREHARVAEERSGRPPGWSKGKKTGWGDCDVPPGQAKKIGCNPYDRRAAYPRYPRRDGRRPVIGGTRPTTRRPSSGETMHQVLNRRPQTKPSSGETMHQVLNKPQTKPSSGETMHQVLNKPQTKPSSGQVMHQVVNGKAPDKR